MRKWGVDGEGANCDTNEIGTLIISCEIPIVELTNSIDVVARFVRIYVSEETITLCHSNGIPVSAQKSAQMKHGNGTAIE